MTLVDDKRAAGKVDDKKMSTTAKFMSIEYLGQIVCQLRTPPPASAPSDDGAAFQVQPTTSLDDMSVLLDAADAVAAYLLDRNRGSAAALVGAAAPRTTHPPVSVSVHAY